MAKTPKDLMLGNPLYRTFLRVDDLGCLTPNAEVLMRRGCGTGPLPCGPSLRPPLSFLDPGPACTTGQRPLGRVARCAPSPEPCAPLDSSIRLVHAIVEVWALAAGNRRAMLCMVALAGRFLGRTPGARHLFWHVVPSHSPWGGRAWRLARLAAP
jgi:hypothetical protein